MAKTRADCATVTRRRSAPALLRAFGPGKLFAWPRSFLFTAAEEAPGIGIA